MNTPGQRIGVYVFLKKEISSNHTAHEDEGGEKRGSLNVESAIVVFVKSVPEMYVSHEGCVPRSSVSQTPLLLDSSSLPIYPTVYNSFDPFATLCVTRLL